MAITIKIAWDIRQDKPIVVIYRRHGKVERIQQFYGPAFVLEQDRETLRYVPREELPLKNKELDLRRMPVVAFAGSATRNWNRAVEFIGSNLEFHGALLLYEGAGQLDVDAGKLIFTEENLLDPRTMVRGTKPNPPQGFVAWEERIVEYGFNLSKKRREVRLWRADGQPTEWSWKVPRGSRILPEILAQGECIVCSRVLVKRFDGKDVGLLGERFAGLAARFITDRRRPGIYVLIKDGQYARPCELNSQGVPFAPTGYEIRWVGSIEICHHCWPEQASPGFWQSASGKPVFLDQEKIIHSLESLPLWLVWDTGARGYGLAPPRTRKEMVEWIKAVAEAQIKEWGPAMAESARELREAVAQFDKTE